MIKIILQIENMGVVQELSHSNYTPVVLFGLGIAGILLHNLIKMDKINRLSDGNFNYAKYFGLEKFSIILSVILVITSVVIRGEIKELEQAGKWLGFAFIAIGYLSQSLLVSFMGRTEKKVNDFTNPNAGE